jgi:hypothetical protein
VSMGSALSVERLNRQKRKRSGSLRETSGKDLVNGCSISTRKEGCGKMTERFVEVGDHCRYAVQLKSAIS